MFSSDALKLYALAATLVSIQLVLLALWTGTVRARTKHYVIPEDAKLNKVSVPLEDNPRVVRAQGAHYNLMESAIPFFPVAFLYALTGATKSGALAYFGTFVVARVLHSIFYLAGLQPFRTLAFLAGILAILGMAVHVMQAAIG